MNILLIGAGGVSSYLYPLLLRIFAKDLKHIEIFDKDTLEERNLERQVFDKKHVGKYKVEAMCSKHTELIPKTCSVRAVAQWFSPDSKVLNKIDYVLCCADNHTARRLALDFADSEEGCKAIIGGNEYFSSQAYIWSKTHMSLEDRPDRRMSLAGDHGSPLHCDSAEALDHSPQLALANSMCANMMLHLLYVWSKPDYLANADLLPIQMDTAETGISVIINRKKS